MDIETATRRPGESISAWYWRRAVSAPDWFLEDRATTGSDVLPPLTKIYPDLPLEPLPPPEPVDLGDAGTLLAQPRGRPRTGSPVRLDPRDDTSLSSFLHYAFGLSRHVMGADALFPLHRYVPSARCRYPTQLYALLPGSPSRRQGAYYFDAAHHALVPVAPGARPADLGLPAGTTREHEHPPGAVFVLTSLYWNTAVTYEHYAFRLCTQEVGLTLGNLELVAAAHGLHSQRHHGFDARALSLTLGLPEEEESPMAVLAVAGGRPVTWAARQGPADPRPPHDFLGRAALDRRRARAMVVADRHTRAARQRPPWPARQAPPAPPARPPAGPLASMPSMPLTTALARRDSGEAVFGPRSEPVPVAALAAICQATRIPDSTDAGVALRILVVARSVHGLDEGAHEWDAEGCTFRLVRVQQVAALLEEGMALAPSVRARAAPALVFVVADHVTVEARWGDCALAVLSAEAGAATQRLLVAAAVGELSGRIVNAFHPGTFRRLTGLDDERFGPVFSVFLGRKSGACAIDFPIWPGAASPSNARGRPGQNRRSSPESRPRSSS